MTQTELAEAYDVFKTIPDPMGFIASRRQLADKIREKLAPVSDIAYGPESVQKLDIYAPENAKSLPVVLDIHGGGWCMGSKEPNAIAAKVAVANKILWVSIDYGLAPDYGMSKIANHVQQAISWTYKNIVS